ncbi:MoaD/ThiS family protein [Microbacterium deminutum]|uniref:Molybdopterin synthase sulfur carrier subunit n=1 Tax=Microbacterium deminutum TaxID=344164 RepID=A0ABN2R453_9MICO
MPVVRYFAAAQEATGLDSERRTETTLGALRRAIAAEHPGLNPILPRCAVLVAGIRVEDGAALAADDLVDVLPPFAGG